MLLCACVRVCARARVCVPVIMLFLNATALHGDTYAKQFISSVPFRHILSGAGNAVYIPGAGGSATVMQIIPQLQPLCRRTSIAQAAHRKCVSILSKEGMSYTVSSLQTCHHGNSCFDNGWSVAILRCCTFAAQWIWKALQIWWQSPSIAPINCAQHNVGLSFMACSCSRSLAVRACWCFDRSARQ